jgi:sugar O-acyltransferase (sialic acid O-acetyltransferase NeuD family)
VRLLVFGAGGHAKVVIDTARSAGFTIAGVIGMPGQSESVLGVPVSHSANGIEADGFIVAIGDNAKRARVFAEQSASGMPAAVVVAPSATISESVTLGAGTFVAPGAIVNVDARIGADAIVNTGCTIDHDCVVGDHALIGPTASLCGGAKVGVGATIGAGVSIVPLGSVGEWSVVGAGAAVVSDIPARTVAVGIPAHAIRTESS